MLEGEFSHYDILEQIGAGGMGEVYRARDRKLKRDVALKILPGDFASMPERRERFLRESRLAAQLAHPNIAMIHEADEVDGQLFYAMELVQGETLEARVRPGGLSRDEFLELAIPLTEGLAEAHRMGIVHRDLKPGNVMVDEQGRLKILDFGLSRLESNEPDSSMNLTRSQEILGTPQYMSPEQVRGQKLDGRSDLFSLGTILYQLATGLRPFYGRTQGEVMESVLNTEPPPMQRANPRIGDHLTRVVERLLDKDPRKRVQTAEDLLAELRSRRDHVERPKVGRQRWLGALLVAAVGIAALFLFASPAGRTPGATKIAVLPFTNSGAEADKYFANGITDAITARLAGIRGLTVISRQSAMQYEASSKSRAEIAAELGVTYLLEGSVQRERAGDPQSQVRVIPRLIKVADGTVPWADTFDNEGSEVFRVQSEIAEGVARALDINLLARERSTLGKKPTENLEAYDSYLRGNDYLARGFTNSNLRIAKVMFERAIERDSNFALAYAQLSRCEIYAYWYRYDRSEKQVVAARLAADRAMQLEPDQPLVRLAMGQYWYQAHLDYTKALEQFAIARRATPGDSRLIALSAYVYRRQGNLARAVEDLEAAQELDPRNVEIATNLGSSYMLIRRFRESAAMYDRVIALIPDYPQSHARKARQALFGEGDPAKARRVVDAAQGVVSDHGHRLLVMTSIQAAIWGEDYTRASREMAALTTDVIEGQYDFIALASLRAMVHQLGGRDQDAKVEYEAARQLVARRLDARPDDANLLSALGIALAGLGRKADAIRAGERATVLLSIETEAWSGSLRTGDLAQIYAQVGEHDRAIDLLAKLLAIPGEIGRASLGVDPRWNPLRGNPRFTALME